LTVLPVSLHAAMALADSSSVRLLMPGGEVRPGELSVVGPSTLAAIAALRLDTVVLACCGISPDGQVTTHDVGDAAVKQALIGCARRSVLVLDGSKFTHSAMAVVCDATSLDVVVTDDTAPARPSRRSRRRGPSCIVSNPVSDVESRPDGAATRLASNGAAGARIAVTVVFVVHGLLFASWTAHIPRQAVTGPDRRTLGFALLGAPVGSVAAMCLAAMLLPRFGSRRIVQVALCGYCAAGPVGLTAPPALFGALVLWGAFQGPGGGDEHPSHRHRRRSRRPLMSGLHGGWSIGAFTGAGIGAWPSAPGSH
jgi:hypothetical protein